MNFFRYLMLFLALGMPLAQTAAQSLDEVKTRMSQRLSQVDNFKQQGVLGEDNRGFLAVPTGVSAPAEARSVMQAENADRQIVYQSIAQQTGASAAQVGQQRAAQIASRSARGLWLQDARGTWYRKR